MRTFLMAVLVVTAVPSFAGEQTLTRDQVPAAVLQRAQTHSPDAKLLAFSLEEAHGVKRYEVTIEDRAGKADLVCDEKGTLLVEERVVTASELPEVVRASLKQSKFAGAKLTTVEKVTHVSEQGRVEWEVVVRDPTASWELVFDAKGTLLHSSRD